MGKIVIDKENIQEWIDLMNHKLKHESLFDFEKYHARELLIVLEKIAEASQPLTEVVKPLLEDAWEEGRNPNLDYENSYIALTKEQYISQTLENLNK